MVEALRIPRGPNRVPDRTWVPRSYGAPITATSASSVARSGAYGTLAKVAMPVKGRFILSVTRRSLRAPRGQVCALPADPLGHEVDGDQPGEDAAADAQAERGLERHRPRRERAAAAPGRAPRAGRAASSA